MNVVFMGTPEFAVPCLERLISDGHSVKGVFTQPDKPKGRGHKMQFSPVKETAIKYDIPVFQPSKMRDAEALKILRELNPEIIIVVAYGKILPQEMIDLPKYGCVNMHASILPRYRGAAPIQWCVINGETESGVTSMQMDAGLDTGDMLICQKTQINENETSGELHDRLSQIGADVMSQTLNEIIEGTLKPVKQNNELSNYAPMLTKELCPVNWNESAGKIHNKVRGLSPWPVATAKLGDRLIKIHETRKSVAADGKPGEIIEAGKRLSVCCGDGNTIEIVTLQVEGKKAMNAGDFLRGNHIEVGEILK